MMDTLAVLLAVGIALLCAMSVLIAAIVVAAHRGDEDDRRRREAFDERAARANGHPRSGGVTVGPAADTDPPVTP
jgi:hypothetical protein